MFVVKHKNGNYYRSCFRGSDKKIVEINWVSDIKDAKVFTEESDANKIVEEKSKICKISKVQVQIIEIE